MPSRQIFNEQQVNITVNRLCYQLIESHNDFSNTVLIGLQPRGIFLLDRIVTTLAALLPRTKIPNGNLDITFFRDDVRRRDSAILPSTTKIDFVIEGKQVILIDDVLHTGRTIRAGLDAMLAFGRPQKVELLVLINRKFSRHLPIEPDFTGKSIDTIESDKVKVQWKETDKEDGVWIYSQNQKK
jgi:pyrimidine operon attenuation protein / uracil phosphoribosyltransferase